MELSGGIPYYNTLTIDILVGKIVKFPTSIVLKGILNFFFHVWLSHGFFLIAALNCFMTTRLLEQMVTAGKWMFQMA